MSRFLPESAQRDDWPRLVAQIVNRAVRAITGLDIAVTTALGDIGDLQNDVSALQTLTDWSALDDYADDAAADAGGVSVGALYRTGSVVKVRVS